jgi:hypothetical protein
MGGKDDCCRTVMNGRPHTRRKPERIALTTCFRRDDAGAQKMDKSGDCTLDSKQSSSGERQSYRSELRSVVGKQIAEIIDVGSHLSSND